MSLIKANATINKLKTTIEVQTAQIAHLKDTVETLQLDKILSERLAHHFIEYILCINISDTHTSGQRSACKTSSEM